MTGKQLLIHPHVINVISEWELAVINIKLITPHQLVLLLLSRQAISKAHCEQNRHKNPIHIFYFKNLHTLHTLSVYLSDIQAVQLVYPDEILV